MDSYCREISPARRLGRPTQGLHFCDLCAFLRLNCVFRIKGTFAAAALATWEGDTKLRICDHFALITGTSTGGILAIGLGLGLPAKDILKFYWPHWAEAKRWRRKSSKRCAAGFSTG